MPITVDSILQWKFYQELSGQQVLNVQYYVVAAEDFGVQTLSGFAQPLFELWTDNLAGVQSTSLFYRKGELYEVNGLEYDAFVPDNATTGTITGEHMPVMNAVSVQQVRATRVTRHGWKRFAGIPDVPSWGANNSLTPTAIAAWEDAVTPLFGEAIVLNRQGSDPVQTITLIPIIWGGNDPGYPMGRYSLISGISVKANISTQNTRKIGRGS